MKLMDLVSLSSLILDKPINDVLDVEIEHFVQNEASRYLCDSTFNLTNCPGQNNKKKKRFEQQCYKLVV